MKQILSNSHLTVEVKSHGAELCNIRGADGVEYLWQADPAVWGSHAPLLFPVIGKLAGNRYEYKGQWFEMMQHGFARKMEFEPLGALPDQLTFRLVASPESRRQYPFEFELTRDYRLIGNTLLITNKVHNPGDSVMPFSIGEHPGFSLKWGKDDEIADYYLEFEKEEPLITHLLDGNSLLSPETERVPTTGRKLLLRRDLFDRDALIFLNLKSEKISLCRNGVQRRLTVQFSGFPCMGIWAKPGAPYVCIEPWYGHADTSEQNGALLNKAGIIFLNPSETFCCRWSIAMAGSLRACG